MDKKLFYVTSWNKNKESTWSGTTYSLYKALTHYFNVIDVPVPVEKPSLIYKIFKKMGFSKNDLGLHFFKKQRHAANEILNKYKGPHLIFQFFELFNDSSLNKTCIYIDAPVCVLKNLERDSPTIYYNLFVNDANALSIRNNSQMGYFNSCSAIFTMGKWIRKALIGEGINPEKIVHVGGGINLDKNHIDYSLKQGNKFLFVGRDFKRKGLAIVYDAFCLIKKKNPNVELHVAGPQDDPYPQHIDGYYFYGDCHHGKLEKLFNKCDVFCMPSYYEAYGLVFIEALVYGLPCIGRNCNEMPYFIEDGFTGYLVNNDDIHNMAAKMLNLLSNKNVISEVRARRDKYITEYSWDTVANRIYDTLKNM